VNPEPEKERVLFFQDDFSIDKSGIALLMEVIQKLRQKNTPIVMENLSYNYLRIFQMAGMDKFAILKEALTDD
jgi:anti-anti-sigma regulatory factor